MMTFGFSPSTKSFFWMEEKSVYLKYTNWVDDIIEVTDETWREFSSIPPSGKELGVQGNGKPCWVDVKRKLNPNLAAENEEKKQALLNIADAEIRQLNVVKEIYGLTDDENLKLIAWKKHLAEVYRYTCRNEGPEQWPEPPDIQ
ncbi:MULTISPECIES: tail fiber assembly protein [unclassified Pantoea]|uniref:tail fiber assembly protein n=1 Tax=unclassified Pantoea TaxID=2630326 RepID=UPI00301DAD2A